MARRQRRREAVMRKVASAVRVISQYLGKVVVVVHVSGEKKKKLAVMIWEEHGRGGAWKIMVWETAQPFIIKPVFCSAAKDIMIIYAVTTGHCKSQPRTSCGAHGHIWAELIRVYVKGVCIRDACRLMAG
ncbi:hypothetical protein E2C01_069212 [Portunus trituberculatus]|uniref:Uncharacterized protein n=1 Tax=Portunus trituberculatus TaxID=210409 RepID=A0A5B7HYM7_PORTR|nr:hypothetical protein [Portunus trituberculatus]